MYSCGGVAPLSSLPIGPPGLLGFNDLSKDCVEASLPPPTPPVYPLLLLELLDFEEGADFPSWYPPIPRYLDVYHLLICLQVVDIAVRL